VSNNFAAIPDVGNTTDSIRDAVIALKQNMESLTQQRGAANKAVGAVTFSDLATLGLTDKGYAPQVGAWINYRIAKTGPYTVANTDSGATLALGGAAAYTLTFGSATAYSPRFVVAVTNEDALYTKTIAISGLSSFKLWPGQTIFVYNNSGVWRSTGPYRWLLTGATTFNVNHGVGNDANDGLTTGNSLATIGQAVTNLQTLIDLGGTNPTIKNADETFTENVSILNGFTGGHEITIQGNSGTPSNCVWNSSTACLAVRDVTIVELNGFKLTGSGSQGLLTTQSAVIDFQNIEFGTFASGVHVQCDSDAVVNDTGGTYKVSGNCVFHWQVQNGGRLNILPSRTISVPNALTFTDFLYCQTGGCYFQRGWLRCRIYRH
jgi:hypothetical protein